MSVYAISSFLPASCPHSCFAVARYAFDSNEANLIEKMRQFLNVGVKKSKKSRRGVKEESKTIPVGVKWNATAFPLRV